jgi:FkbM family methyltransferase
MQPFKRAFGLPLRFARAQRRRARFDAICRQNGLKLDYERNKEGMDILDEVFVQRLYADYFPFYRCNTILDVGGHFGYFAIFAAMNSAPNSRIVTVEPSSQNVAILRANIAGCGLPQTQINVIHGAAADQTGTLDLHVSKAHNCSLYADHAKSIAPGSTMRTERVNVHTLADLMAQHELLSVDVMKLDCEGAEYPIIYNTPTDVLGRVKVIMMEFHDMKDPERDGLSMVRQLADKGFRVVLFRHLPTTMNFNYGKIIAVRD